MIKYYIIVIDIEHYVSHYKNIPLDEDTTDELMRLDKTFCKYIMTHKEEWEPSLQCLTLLLLLLFCIFCYKERDIIYISVV